MDAEQLGLLGVFAARICPAPAANKTLNRRARGSLRATNTRARVSTAQPPAVMMSALITLAVPDGAEPVRRWSGECLRRMRNGTVCNAIV